MADTPNPLDKELERLDKLEAAAWKSYETAAYAADAARFLQLVLDTIHKRCELLNLT